MEPYIPPADAPYPVAHSVISADFLAHEIDRLYDLGGPAHVHLLYRGMNDIYIVDVGDTRYAMRSWRLWRSEAEVNREITFLDYLKDHGFSAAHPVHMKDGRGYFPVPAPEGLRFAALFEWAPGVKFRNAPDHAIAERIGEMMAELHNLGLGFQTDSRPARHTEPLPTHNAVLEMLMADHPDALRDYPKLAAGINAKMAELATKGLSWGQAHTDFHPSNVHVDAASGKITFLDFDASAPGYLAFDLANNIFAHGFYGMDMSYADSFMKGYEKVRPLSDADRDALPILILYKTYSLLDGIAQNANFIGHNALNIRGVDWFWSKLRPLAAEQGLL